MTFTEKLIYIDDLKAKIENYGALPVKVLNKINYKFRLEWNFYSNSIEGNTLTMQETRSIMIGNVTVNGKPVKDVMEMKGHDDVISSILKIGKSELNISESRIRKIHEGIMHEDDPEKQQWIGKWKHQPNYIYNYKGERFDFTPPADVSDEMHRLINWLNKEKENIERNDKSALHPIQLALQFNLDYITIHPFYDGNGRTVRILTNLILISYGYPPVYVKTVEKNTYYQYLGEVQCYDAPPDLFNSFMADLLIRSMNLVLDAIEGRGIEEQDDIDKELRLLQNAVKQKEIIPPDAPKRPNVDDVLLKYLGELIKSFHQKLAAIRGMFAQFEEAVLLFRIKERIKDEGIKIYFDRIMEAYKINYETEKPPFHMLLTNSNTEFANENIELMAYYNNMENVNDDVSIKAVIPFKFRRYNYECFGSDGQLILSKTYNELLSEKEITLIVNMYIKKLIDDIKSEVDLT